jgi:hypothetical protein
MSSSSDSRTRTASAITEESTSFSPVSCRSLSIWSTRRSRFEAWIGRFSQAKVTPRRTLSRSKGSRRPSTFTTCGMISSIRS